MYQKYGNSENKIYRNIAFFSLVQTLSDEQFADIESGNKAQLVLLDSNTSFQ